MSLAARHLSPVASERAVAYAEVIDNWVMEWANECLRGALQAGQSTEVPFYKRALDHAASVKSGREMTVVLADKSCLNQGLQALSPAFMVAPLEGVVATA